MGWPWSRRESEVGFLRRQNELLLGQLIRLVRKEHGLPEVALDLSRREPDAPPARLVDLCARFETHGPALLEELKKEHRMNGTSWDVLTARVAASLIPQVEENDL